MTLADSDWHYLVLSDTFWLCLALPDCNWHYIWPCLTISDPVWQCLALSDNKWLSLTISGSVWKYLTRYANIFIRFNHYHAWTLYRELSISEWGGGEQCVFHPLLFNLGGGGGWFIGNQFNTTCPMHHSCPPPPLPYVSQGGHLCRRRGVQIYCAKYSEIKGVRFFSTSKVVSIPSGDTWI